MVYQGRPPPRGGGRLLEGAAADGGRGDHGNEALAVPSAKELLPKRLQRPQRLPADDGPACGQAERRDARQLLAEDGAVDGGSGRMQLSSGACATCMSTPAQISHSPLGGDNRGRTRAVAAARQASKQAKPLTAEGCSLQLARQDSLQEALSGWPPTTLASSPPPQKPLARQDSLREAFSGSPPTDPASTAPHQNTPPTSPMRRNTRTRSEPGPSSIASRPRLVSSPPQSQERAFGSLEDFLAHFSKCGLHDDGTPARSCATKS